MEQPVDRHLLDRVRELATLGEHVDAELELAVYRAHEAGAAPGELARLAGWDAWRVTRSVQRCAGSDLTDCTDELHWVLAVGDTIYA